MGACVLHTVEDINPGIESLRVPERPQPLHAAPTVK